jgi:hypothetical protein
MISRRSGTNRWEMLRNDMGMDVDDHYHPDFAYGGVKTYFHYHDHGVVWCIVKNA